MAKDDGPDDPFEGLVLDDDFVRKGRYEAPARTRHALSQPPPPRRGEVPPPSPPPRRQPRRTKALVAAVVIALLVVGGALAVTHATSSGHPSTTSTPSTSTTPDVSSGPTSTEAELSNQAYRVGGCYTWDETLAHTTARQVSCGQPHLAEMVKHLTLQGYGAKAAYPSDAQWDAITTQLCTAPVTAFLGYPLDPAGRFGRSLIKPLPAGWDNGDRSMECDLVDHRLRTVSYFRGPFAPRDAPFTGEVRGVSQAPVIPRGTCTVTQTLPGHPVQIVTPCAGAHATEYVGSFALPAGGSHPSDTAYARLVNAHCNTLATAYAGHAVEQTATQYVGGDLISATSWADGDRTVNCAVYSVVSGTSRPREVSGSVRTS